MRPRFLDELKCMYNVETAALSPGSYGWGFIKLEPLFQEQPERFLMLDSDTVLLGPVLETANNHQTDFIVDFEQQTDSRAKEIYFNWEIGEQSGFGMAQPDFLFNTGQWFARSRVLRRASEALVSWAKDTRRDPGTLLVKRPSLAPGYCRSHRKRHRWLGDLRTSTSPIDSPSQCIARHNHQLLLR